MTLKKYMSEQYPPTEPQPEPQATGAPAPQKESMMEMITRHHVVVAFFVVAFVAAMYFTHLRSLVATLMNKVMKTKVNEDDMIVYVAIAILFLALFILYHQTIHRREVKAQEMKSRRRRR